MEVGLDEAGRGPLFGRVYAAAVVLNEGFDVSRVKDSKKFTSEKKRKEAAEYIMANSVWNVSYMDETVIDKVNILQATMRAMHAAVLGLPCTDIQLLVDGNYFKPIYNMNKYIPYNCIEGGDNKYSSIAAASILAKVARDEYIDDNTNRLVGDTMGKSEHIVRKVKDEYGYNIPLSTLNAFCVSQKITLSDFFKMLEEKNGSVIEDSFKIIQVEKKKRTKKDS